MNILINATMFSFENIFLFVISELAVKSQCIEQDLLRSNIQRRGVDKGIEFQIHSNFNFKHNYELAPKLGEIPKRQEIKYYLL